MPRAVLAYPLIVAMAVGPLLCCCTAGRVLGSHAPAPTNAQRPAPCAKPVASGHSCCTHKQKKDKPAKPAPSKPGQCPCKDGASKVPATEATSSDQFEPARAVTLDYLVPTAGPERLVSFEEGVNCSGSARLFLSVSDLLFTHHKLRC
jgi:hypothetical protein